MPSQINVDHKTQKKNTILSKKTPTILPSASAQIRTNEEHNIQRSEGSQKIKYLPPSVLKDIEQKNAARKLAGLPSISTRIRRCLFCGTSFQSAGNRTCGCTSRVAGSIAGREILF